MFGIGMQEMVIIGVLLLIVFGPGRLPLIVKDVGRFVGEARRTVDEFKQDLTSEDSLSGRDAGQESHEDQDAEAGKPGDEDREVDAPVARSLPPAE